MSASSDTLASKPNLRPCMLIGNSRLSSQLEYIPRIAKMYSKLPIISFTLNYKLRSKVESWDGTNRCKQFKLDSMNISKLDKLMW